MRNFNLFSYRYKFYLSFENSYHCKDYMSEKLWRNALYSGSVLITLGAKREDVAAVLPPKSYLHVDDFKSPEDLVKYMRFLDKNITAYAEYLNWRTWLRFFDKNGVYNPADPDVKQKLSEVSEEERSIVDKYMQ